MRKDLRQLRPPARLALVAALLGLLSTGACVRVKAYQRAEHAKKIMQDPDSSEAKLDGHVQEYREGAIGGSGGGGGGCGCN